MAAQIVICMILVSLYLRQSMIPVARVLRCW